MAELRFVPLLGLLCELAVVLVQPLIREGSIEAISTSADYA